MSHSSAQSNDPVSTAVPQAARAAAAAGQRVLVIDDDEAVRKSLSAILTTRGYLAVEAESGPVALAILQASGERIDAVVLDHNMPGMNGHEVLAALRAIHPHLPVVMASGYELEGAITDTRLRFVQKAHGPRALLSQLGELLQPAA